jgi:hypothetical protein
MKVRNRRLVIVAASFVMTVTGIPIHLHLYLAGGHHTAECTDCETEHSQEHDSEDCPICRVMFLSPAKSYLTPPTLSAATEDLATAAPEMATTFAWQLIIAPVLAPRPPPTAIA